ncbi:hypothetical protein Psyaliredsea_14060 [Psychrobacter alimentarius]
MVDLSRYQKVDVNKLSGGLLPVQRNNRVGYLNMKGREVVPAMYDVLSESQGWARPVSDGRIVVKKMVIMASLILPTKLLCHFRQ